VGGRDKQVRKYGKLSTQMPMGANRKVYNGNMNNPFQNGEMALALAICERWPQLTAHKTGAETARLDCIFTVGNKVRAVAEMKKRKFDWKRQERYGSTLIEHSKYQAGLNTSQALGVPFLVIVQLTDRTMFWQVTDEHGQVVIPIKRTNKEAQVSEANKTKVMKDCILLSNEFGRML